MTTRRRDTGTAVCGWESARGICLVAGTPRCPRHTCMAPSCAEGKASDARVCDGCAAGLPPTSSAAASAAATTAAEIERLLASDTVSPRVHEKIAKLRAEAPSIKKIVAAPVVGYFLDHQTFANPTGSKGTAPWSLFLDHRA